MNQLRHRAPWPQRLALAGLLSLLILSAISAAHLHRVPTKSAVRGACQLCMAGGMSPSLFVGSPLVAAEGWSFLLLPVVAPTPRRACRQQSGAPRSPPYMVCVSLRAVTSSALSS